MKNLKTGQEWLWHGTSRTNLETIRSEGLKPNHLGCISLTPKFKIAQRYGEVVLQVDVTGGRMTQFEGGEEILYWTDKPIPPEKLQYILGQV